MDNAAGNGEAPSQQSLQAKAAMLDEREALLRTMQDALEARTQAMEDAQQRADVSTSELEVQNSELREVNAKLVIATLTAQELREAAQMARRRQDEFLAMLAHELRNPLAPISAATEVLARLDGKAIPDKLLDVVRRQVKHLVRLVDDLLDISRVTEGKVLLQRQPMAVADIVHQAIDTCRDEFDGRNHWLDLEPGAEAFFVDGDSVRLTQVFTNLLLNAAKYTPSGGEISLETRRLGTNVEIRVRDNGVGITAEALPHIFDLFVQEERPLNRSQGGLGIGLTIVRRIVEMHGGSVEARSGGRDAGTEFIVSLPLVEPLSEPRSAPRAVMTLAPTSARILIVEDNVDAGTVLADLLRLSGHEVDVALDGPSGLEHFEQMQPQVVLCDIGLPGLDGYELGRLMRKAGHEPRPALIAVTGYGGPTNVNRALTAGFDHHVCKPVNPETVLRLIDSAIRLEDWTTSGHGALTSHGSLPDDRHAQPT